MIEEVIELSGLKEQIAQIPGQILFDTNRRGKGQLPKEFASLITESYKAAESYQMAVDYFLLNYDENRFLSLLKSLKSPLLRKVVQAEIESGRPEKMPEMQAFLTDFESKKPSPERIALIKKMDETIGISDKVAEMAITTAQQISKLGTGSLTPAEQLLMERSWERNRLKMKEHFFQDDQFKKSLIFIYQSLSDEEITAYIEFSESDVGQWYQKIGFEVYQAVVSEFFTEFFKLVSDKLQESWPGR